jgi:hypothetical protein
MTEEHKIDSEQSLFASIALLKRLWFEHKYLLIKIIPGKNRTLEQNSKQWPMLTDISKQVQWAGHWLTPDEWKDLATASFRGCKVLPNLDFTGVVAVGLRTSKMGRKDFSDYIEYLYSFGADHNVVWSEKSVKTINEEIGK